MNVRPRWLVPAALLLVAGGVFVVLGLRQTGTDSPPAPALELDASDRPASQAAIPATAEPPAAAREFMVRHVTVLGGGRRDGVDEANAGRLEDVPDLLAASAPGDEIWIHAGEGPYRFDEQIPLRHGGAPGLPVVIRGVDRDGVRPEIVGSRSDPYDPEGSQGSEVFRLLSGADHLRFANLAFRNHGNGCFRIGEDIADLGIEHVEATNVGRLVENTASGDAPTATITGVTIRDSSVRGFSDGAIRLRYDTSNVVIADVRGDAQAQPQRGEDFPIGVSLSDTVHDVELNRVAMHNSRSEPGPDEYWNGDGFAAERGTYDLRFTDTQAVGNSDAGYDLKSASTTLMRATAEDNSRNFRLWGDGIEADDCVASAPHRRGGRTTQAQVQVAEGARAVLRGCSFADSDERTIVFDVDDDGRLVVEGGTVRHAAAGQLETVEEDASLDLVSVTVEPAR